MEYTGEFLCTLGYCGRSGMAGGADQAFYRGALRSPRIQEVGFENYLPNSWMMGRPDPDNLIFDATTLPHYAKAQELALQARGSFEGLKSGGIALHTRNAYQVLGQSLHRPSKMLICYALPVGKSGTVKGGTNTAVKIALSRKIPVINLATEEGLMRIQRFVETHRHTDIPTD